jgi:hypothetical protein
MTPKQITGGAYEEHYLFLSEMIDVSSNVDNIFFCCLITLNHAMPSMITIKQVWHGLRDLEDIMIQNI